MMNILLFGGGLQVLAVARGLVECGYIVDAIGSDNKISRKSRFIRRCININIDNLLVDDFIQIIKSSQYKVIIPTEDEYASWLSYNKIELEENTEAKCAVMDYETFSFVINKTSFLDFLHKENLPHPKTALINDNHDEIAKYVGFPALIKPSISAGARGIKIVHNISELKILSSQIINEYGESSLQEYINNNNHYYNVMLYRTKKGVCQNYTITKIIRYYPIKGGSSSFCYTIENDKLLKICTDTLNRLNWFGFADFDILENGPGDYRIIEINPRVPASVKAAYVSGVNFGEIIVRDTLGEDVPSYSYKIGKQLRYLGLDIAWFIASPNRWKCKPNWFLFFGKDLHYQEGGIHDFPAMLTSIWCGIKKLLNPDFRRSKAGMN